MAYSNRDWGDIMRLFDLHCDTITELCSRKENLINGSCHISLDRACFDEGYAQTFAIYMPDQYRGQGAIDFFDRNLEYFNAQMLRYSSRIEQARTSVQIDAVLKRGKTAAILAVEGGSVLAGDLSRVRWLKEQGVAFLTLTWNGENELGSGWADNLHLSTFGKEAVAELERCGIVVDVSHLSDNGFDDLLEVATKPFVATHSNARAVCGAPRNLRDDQFCEIVRRGGLVGINFVTDFLRKSDKDALTFADILRHVEHFLTLGGEKILALGADYDGCTMSSCLDSIEKIAKLYDFMVQSISKRLVDQLFFENASRFCKENLL